MAVRIVSTPADEEAPLPFATRRLSLSRRIKNHAATVAMWLSFFVAAVPLGFVIYYVAKDEQPPDPAPFEKPQSQPQISAHAPPKVNELVPPKEWPGDVPHTGPAMLPSATDDAYLQWRALVRISFLIERVSE